MPMVGYLCKMEAVFDAILGLFFALEVIFLMIFYFGQVLTKRSNL